MQKLIIGGVYQHYKTQGLYKVLGIALHSETQEELVIYQPLHPSTLGNDFWARPKKMFLEEVAVNKIIQPRFKLIKKT